MFPLNSLPAGSSTISLLGNPHLEKAYKPRIRRAKLIHWKVPLPDSLIELELRHAADTPFASLEADPVDPGTKPPPEGILSALFLPIQLLAVVISYVLGQTMLETTCRRFATARRFVRLQVVSKQQQLLQQAMDFRESADFEPARAELNKRALNLEVAKDLTLLEASSLLSLRSQRQAPLSVIYLVRALFLLLVESKPGHGMLGPHSGVWNRDRLILDPAILAQQLVLFSRHLVPRETWRRLLSEYCTIPEVSPQEILSLGVGEEGPFKTHEARDAAAALSQWLWLQISFTESLESTSQEPIGELQRMLMLQPTFARDRIHRYLQMLQLSLEKFRSGKYFEMLKISLQKQINVRGRWNLSQRFHKEFLPRAIPSCQTLHSSTCSRPVSAPKCMLAGKQPALSPHWAHEHKKRMSQHQITETSQHQYDMNLGENCFEQSLSQSNFVRCLARGKHVEAPINRRRRGSRVLMDDPAEKSDLVRKGNGQILMMSLVKKGPRVLLPVDRSPETLTLVRRPSGIQGQRYMRVSSELKRPASSGAIVCGHL